MNNLVIFTPKIVHKLNINKHGLGFIREFIGEQGVFVMGEIHGLIPSFSSLQDLQPNQRRRFAATSWGTYKKIPPIQKFLRKKSSNTPFNNHQQKHF